ncbi:sulfatase [Novipirellula artificiosorum]|uniref:Arylsulfatase n=1 Tax=Novipirellula artificiosorum TaxID=2528016 RepID=A0A5C6DP97_9BACT|nr:sulfatase [Novipirellula artificiosorum]TWU38548.1 Arylsulfatase [Novipirellula artificiosorum]
MNRIVLLFVSLMIVMATSSRADAEHHNIVLFLIDDLGWMDLGCQGSTYYKTPHIDELAAEGVRFTDAYAACAVCSPTRASILTGKYPARLLLTDWLPSGRWDPNARLIEGRKIRGLPVEEFTLAEALRDVGYQTIHIGKWHLGSEPFCLPEHHGFDINIAGNAHGAPGQYFFPYQGNWSIPTTPHRAKWNVLPDGQAGEYLTDRLTDEAVGLIEQSGEKPFFLYFPHYGVHSPLQAPEKLTKKYERVPKAKRQGKPVYAAMVESIDDSVGRVLNALRASGKDDNTVIIFTSDNGGFYKATSNAPLRANKGSYYEGGIRVPLIIKWPGVSHAGRVIHEAVISNDLYPTCLSAAGVELNPNQHMDGVNLKPLLSATEDLPRESLFWHFPHYNKHPSSHPSSVIRKGDWKLIESFDPATVELYNLGQDLGETTNLAQSEPARRNELLQELDAWRVAVGAERMKPNPDAASKDNREDTTAR